MILTEMLGPKDEKKVEYLELIYDLIFVYIIGRNSSLLHNVVDGFVPGPTFLAYVLSSLATIQIWNFSTFYINMYGRNKLRDHVSLFLNMYLLYYIGEGTHLQWENYQNQYSLAWALILVNIGVQYLIERRNHPNDPAARRTIDRMMLVLFGEAAIILVGIPLYNRTGAAISGLAILFGIVMTSILAVRSKSGRVDFAHLSERAMLYVVFTFGEMIIVLASYFEGDFTANNVYFSAMSFLIVVGLFLCYEVLYDRIIDRERSETTGMLYMILHIFLIFGMNILTMSLEFMQDPEIALLPKTVFLISSFLLYFVCLFALQHYAKPELRLCTRFTLPIGVITVAFIVLMFLLREQMYLNILVSVLYVFAVFLELWFFSKSRACAGTCACE